MTKNNKLSFNKWLDFAFNIYSNIITENLIRMSLLEFEDQIISQINNDNNNSSIKLLILFKIKTINFQYRTITPPPPLRGRTNCGNRQF
jgi:hypothetical protein